jgi:beta-lactam-binding protein with PASTA domain
LIGLPEAQAQGLITQSGLSTGYVNYQTIANVADHQYFRSIAPGHVLSQSVAPGQRVPRGTRILIAVRKA